MIFGNLILDALLVVFLALGFWYGWQRGFLRIVLKTFAGLFSAVIAMTFFDDLGATLKEKYVFDFVKGKVSGSLAELGAGVDADTIVDKVPDGLQNAASIVGIDLGAMAENAVQSGKDAVAEFAELASHSISQLIASVAAFAIIFLVSLLVLRVFANPISTLIMKIPVLGQINRFLGLVFGALTAIVIAWIAIKLVGFLDEATGLEFIEVGRAWIAGAFYRFSLFS